MKELQQALATAQAEHMDYDFLQLQLQESETTHAQQQKVLHVYEPSIISHATVCAACTQQCFYTKHMPGVHVCECCTVRTRPLHGIELQAKDSEEVKLQGCCRKLLV